MCLIIQLLFLGSGKCDESDCSNCELTDRVYACLDEYTYALCLNTDTIQTDTIDTCPTGTYCNVVGGFYCTSSDTTSVSTEKS